jgi:hypothetical protein
MITKNRTGKETEYMVRVIVTKTGKLKLGYVDYFAHVEKKGSKYTTWKPAPAAFRREFADVIGAKLI